MQKRTALIIALACLVLVSVGGYFLFLSDEDDQIINRNLERLVELAGKTGDESFIVGISQGRDIARLFAQDAEVELGSPLPLIGGRSELEGIIIQVRQSLQTISIGVSERELEIADDGETARLTLNAEGRITHAGERARETRKFTIDWIKEDGDWLIRKVTLDGVL